MAKSLNVPYLVLTGVLVAAIIGLVWMARVEWVSFNEISATREVVREEKDKLERVLQSIDRKSQELSTRTAEERELAVMLPTNESSDDILRILDQYAAASGVVISQVANNTVTVASRERAARSQASGAIPAAVSPVGLSVELQGTYPQVRQFLALLEDSARLADVQSLQLSRSGQVELVDAQLVVQFYRLGEL